MEELVMQDATIFSREISALSSSRFILNFRLIAFFEDPEYPGVLSRFSKAWPFTRLVVSKSLRGLKWLYG